MVQIERLIKFVVKRGQGSVTSLVFPTGCARDDIICVSDECPKLKFLALPLTEVLYPGLISKWKKNLDMLSLGVGGSDNAVVQILYQISLHCKNFARLCVQRDFIANEIASAILMLVPNIKYLILDGSCIHREDLMMILKGCKKLVKLHVRRCTSFEGDGDKILKLASHIKHSNICKSPFYSYDNYRGWCDCFGTYWAMFGLK